MSKAKEVKGEQDESNVQESEEETSATKKEDTKEKKTEKKVEPDSKQVTKEGDKNVAKEDPAQKNEKENGEFSAIEIRVPTTELAKDKELIKKI
jgi:hypothetical protein